MNWSQIWSRGTLRGTVRSPIFCLSRAVRCKDEPFCIHKAVYLMVGGVMFIGCANVCTVNLERLQTF